MWRILRQEVADPCRGLGENRLFKILKGREAALMRAPLSLIRILKAERGAFKSGRFAWEGLQKRPDQDDPVAGSRQGGFYKTVILRGRCSKNLDPVVDPVTGSAKRNRDSARDDSIDHGMLARLEPVPAYEDARCCAGGFPN